MHDTIFAIATAKGRAGVAIVRLSGPGARLAAEGLVGPLPLPRLAVLRQVVWQGDALDQALVLRFDAGASFTGEEVVELQLHGSLAVCAAVLSVLGGLAGLRLAEPGEFTRRALENGVLDLTQVEALADLIDAETEAQRRQAQRVLSGAMGTRVAAWRGNLIRAAALVEATIDFADEDVPVDVSGEVLSLLDAQLAALHHEVAAGQMAERVRHGFEVAIVGAPNAGKSTLLNMLAGRDAALTSEVAGTTRDVIEVRMDLGGLPVTLLDTAGIRETQDWVEQMGIDRAMERANAADLRVFLVSAEDERLPMPKMPGDLVLISKSDQKVGLTSASVSGRTGAGVDGLLARVTSELSGRVVQDGVTIRARHVQAIQLAIVALESARDQVRAGLRLPEIVAADIRRATVALDVLVGRVGVEDLLGEIFSSFCIGK